MSFHTGQKKLLRCKSNKIQWFALCLSLLFLGHLNIRFQGDYDVMNHVTTTIEVSKI